MSGPDQYGFGLVESPHGEATSCVNGYGIAPATPSGASTPAVS